LVFTTARAGPVSVRIVDVTGRVVRSLYDAGPWQAGRHALALDGRGDDGARLGPGIYFCQIRSAEGSRAGRFAIVN
jgi:flagellar hook assembly protein FlgD